MWKGSWTSRERWPTASSDLRVPRDGIPHRGMPSRPAAPDHRARYDALAEQVHGLVQDWR
ncbi:MAG: hypothetical protein ACOYBU_18245 [Dermatophilaceae bacterium]